MIVYLMQSEQEKKALTHWRNSIIITLSILSIWFLCSFGCGIIWRDWCDAKLPSVGHAPFGFWMAQQGSIIIFVILLVVYATLMRALDRQLDS